MRNILSILILLLALLLATPRQVLGQASSPPPAEPLDASEKQAILQEVGKVLQENYIFAETAETMLEGVEKQMKGGAYDSLNTPEAFAEAVSEDLRKISKDKHLRFRYDPEAEAQGQREDSKSEEERKKEREAQRAELARDNFGFRKVELLPGK